MRDAFRDSSGDPAMHIKMLERDLSKNGRDSEDSFTWKHLSAARSEMCGTILARAETSMSRTLLQPSKTKEN